MPYVLTPREMSAGVSASLWVGLGFDFSFNLIVQDKSLFMYVVGKYFFPVFSVFMLLTAQCVSFLACTLCQV